MKHRSRVSTEGRFYFSFPSKTKQRWVTPILVNRLFFTYCHSTRAATWEEQVPLHVFRHLVLHKPKAFLHRSWTPVPSLQRLSMSLSISSHTSLILCSLFIPSTLAFLSLQLSYTLKIIYIYLPTFLGVSGRTGFRLYWSTNFFVIGSLYIKRLFTIKKKRWHPPYIRTFPERPKSL